MFCWLIFKRLPHTLTVDISISETWKIVCVSWHKLCGFNSTTTFSKKVILYFWTEIRSNFSQIRCALTLFKARTMSIAFSIRILAKVQRWLLQIHLFCELCDIRHYCHEHKPLFDQLCIRCRKMYDFRIKLHSRCELIRVELLLSNRLLRSFDN